jgi:hypothetical protein
MSDVASVPLSSERVNKKRRGERVITYLKARRMAESDETN